MRREFIECKSGSTASRRAPWAAIICRVEGGFIAFESMQDYRTWREAKMTDTKFELTFWGGVSKRYTRNHETYDAAKDEAVRVLLKLDNRAAHPAIIYGPGCGKDGVTIP
jgi:hypothetical protein